MSAAREALGVHRRTVRAVLGWSLVAAVPVLLSGLLVARAVDAFVRSDERAGIGWLVLDAVLAIIGAAGTRQAFARIADIVEPVRDDLTTGVVFSALRRASAPGAREHTADTARVTEQVELVRQALAGVLLAGLEFALVLVAALAGLVLLQPALILLVLPPLLVGLAGLALVVRRMASAQTRSLEADEVLAAEVAAVGTALRDIRAVGAEQSSEAWVGRSIAGQADATRRLGALEAAGTLAVAAGSWVPLLLVLGFGRDLVSGGVTAGAVLGAATYVMQGLQPALDALVRGISGAGLWLVVAWRRVHGAIAAPDPVAPERPPVAGSECGPDGTLAELRSVSFAYGADAEAVVRSLDLAVHRGDHLAVVGPSGVGKSTLVALLCGLLQPASGSACVGGLATVSTSPESLAMLAAKRVLVPQQSYVFAGTLHENLTYLAPEATDEAIGHAADLLGATALVARIGLESDVDVAVLSVAERQLICLVRAYVSPAPLVVLDEATGHLDPSHEAEVEAAFAARPGALVVVAHRMTSAMRARRTLVMDGARVVQGTHAELLAASPLYADLAGSWITPPAARDLETGFVNR